MKRLQLTAIFLFLLFIGANGKNGGTEMQVGVRFLSPHEINDVLTREGFAKLNSNSFYWHIGRMIEFEKWIYNNKICFLSAISEENSKITQFRSWGYSIDGGYKIWSNDKMALYPYFNISCMFSRFNTQQKTEAKSFLSVYQQSIFDRTFINRGELSSALGLSFMVKSGVSFYTIRGGYNFRLWQDKWTYARNVVDFPKVDCRGWEIGITWGILSKKCIKKEE